MRIKRFLQWLKKPTKSLLIKKRREKELNGIIAFADFLNEKERMAGMNDNDEEKEAYEFFRNQQARVLPKIVPVIAILVTANQILSYATLKALAGTSINGFWFYGLLSLIYAGLYLLFCICFAKENEQGIISFLGIPWRTFDMGIFFRLWLFEREKKLTKTRIEVSFEVGEVVTKAGFQYIKEEKRDEDGKLISSEITESRRAAEAKIEITMGAYFSLGGDLRLIKNRLNLVQAVQYLPTEIIEAANAPEVLPALFKKFLGKLIDGKTRGAGAEKTWPEVNDAREALAKEVERRLRDDPTIDQSGLADNLTLVVIHVKIPLELQTALTAVEIAEREKAAEILKAEAGKQATILKAEGEKQAIVLAAEAEHFKLEETGKGAKKAAVLDAEALQQELLNEMLGLGFQAKKEGGFEEKDIEKFMAHREKMRLAQAFGKEKADNKFFTGSFSGTESLGEVALNLLRGGEKKS